MNPPHGSEHTFASTMTLVAVLVAWLGFAPIQIGGQAAYAVVSGNSMEPSLHRGDLVLLRQTTDYRIGDVVIYRHPTLGLVIHRIVAENDGRFALKGDNNTWIDSYKPVPAEMIGKLWVRVPALGRLVEQVRRPWPVALLAGLGVVAVAISITADASRARRSRRRGQPTLRRQPTVTQSSRGSQADILMLLATIGLASLMLGLFAFARPASRIVFDEVIYRHVGQFSYSAAAPPGLYDGNMVKTGEPVFRRLVSRVQVAFDYRLQADSPENLIGDAYLTAVLAGNNGWRSSFTLQDASTFRGAVTQLSGTLDLSQIQAVLDRLGQETGVTSSQYMLAIVPTIAVSGTLSGQALRDTFSPQLVFALDDLQMQLTARPNGDGQEVDPVSPGANKSLRHSREEPNVISLLGFALEVPTVRLLSLIGLTGSLLGIAGLFFAARLSSSGREEERIRSRYGAMLVSVRDCDLLTNCRLAEVASMDDLARIAERNTRTILHQVQGDGRVYFVPEDGITYYYRSTADTRAPAVSATTVPAGEGGR